jgi:replicative DNA helicase
VVHDAHEDAPSPLLADRALETELIGRLLFKPELVETVAGLLRPEHFDWFVAREIYKAQLACLANRAVPDPHAVMAHLDQNPRGSVGRIDVVRLLGGSGYAMDLAGAVRRVRDMARRRALREACERVIGQLATEPDFDILRGDLYRVLDAAEDTTREPETDLFSAVMTEVATKFHAETQDSLATGFVTLDQQVQGGVPRGGLVILGARTSVGKTALAATMAVEWARQGHRVSFISVEMDRLRIGQRYLGAMAEVPVARLNARRLTEDELERMAKAMGEELALCTDDTARSLAQVRSRVSQHRRLMGGLDVVIVDYLQLMDVRAEQGEKRYEAVGRLSRGLKYLARDLNVVVVALAQLNRETEDRKGPPRLSDLRESGNLEQDADQVWLLYRPEIRKGVFGSEVRLIVAKNRQGPTGSVSLHFQAEAMRFLEMEDSE